MRKPRKRAIHKARTGGSLKRDGIYLDEQFESKLKLAPTKNRIKK